MSYACFYLHTFFHASLVVKGVRKVNCGNINPTLLQGASLYIAKKYKDPFDKNAESKKDVITITSLGQLHNIRKENKCAK